MEVIAPPARRVLERLERAGYEAYLVGGCERDLLLDRRPGDWDITTAARPEEVLSLFAPQAAATGLKHGTVTVFEGAASFEVTTFRLDGTYADHRHPDAVTFSDSLAEDLKRRDFTVNAIAMDQAGEITDLFGGREDLARGVLRCVGRPEQRLEEDALRIMRALRFSSVLGFSLAPETADAVFQGKSLLREVAVERVREELLKLLCGRCVVPALLQYAEVLGVVLPEILPAVGCDQRNIHHCYDVWEHIARTVGFVPPDAVLRMTMLLHDLGKPGTMTVDEDGTGHFRGHADVSCTLGKTILERLRFDKESTRRILTLVQWHDVPIEQTQKAMRRLLHKLGERGVRDLLQVKRADNLAQASAYHGRQGQIDTLEALLQQALEQDACFTLRQLAVNGRDLLEQGYRGREVGAALQFMLDAVIDGTLPNEKQALLKVLSTEFASNATE